MSFSQSYKVTWIKRQEAITRLGGKCRECGTDDARVLQISPAGTGASFFNLVRRHPEEFELFCANCNQIKRGSEVPEEWKTRLTARVEKEAISLTDTQKRLVREAVGLGGDDCRGFTRRNQMVRSPFDDPEEWQEWQILVNRGWARHKIKGGNHYFWATLKLAQAVCQGNERVAQDFRWARPNL